MIYTCGLSSSSYGYLAALAIDPSTGSLTVKNSVTESPAGNVFKSLAVSPAGDYLYAISYKSAIYIYSISSSTGALTYVNTCATHQYGSTIRLNTAGSLAFITTADGYFESFSVSGSTLTKVSSVRPASLKTYQAINSLAVDSTNGYVYAVGPDTDSIGTIFSYSYTADGTLTAGPSVVIGSGTYPEFATLDPSGKYLYVGISTSIATYTIGSNGALTLKAKATDSPQHLYSPMAIAFAASGQYAYAIDLTSAVDECSLSEGLLTTFGAVATVSNSNPQSIAIDSVGKYVYVADRETNYIERFSVSSSDGSLASADKLLLASSRLYDVIYLK